MSHMLPKRGGTRERMWPISNPTAQATRLSSTQAPNLVVHDPRDADNLSGEGDFKSTYDSRSKKYDHNPCNRQVKVNTFCRQLAICDTAPLLVEHHGQEVYEGGDRHIHWSTMGKLVQNSKNHLLKPSGFRTRNTPVRVPCGSILVNVSDGS